MAGYLTIGEYCGSHAEMSEAMVLVNMIFAVKVNFHKTFCISLKRN